MATRRTTRCCSALALTLLCSAACAAQTSKARPFPLPGFSRAKGASTPLALFPVHPLWTLPLNLQLSAPPAFEGLHAFFPIEGDRIVAYDLATGTEMWMVQAGTASRPAASPDLLFVAKDATIEALRVHDGSSAWKLPFPDPLAAPLTFDNGWLIAATTDSSIVAFRATDGHEVWRSRIGSPAHAAPTLADDRVYIPAEDGRVVALRVDTGATVWTHALGGAPSEILAVGDRLYVGSKDNFFYCLKSDDGSVDWPVPTGADVIGLPVADDRNVYFVSLDNVLRAVHRSNGNQEWKRALAVRPAAGPLLAGDTIVVTGLSKTLQAFKAKDKGVVAGDLGVGDEVAAPPYVVNLPGIVGPVVIVVTRDIVKGALVTAEARSIEPAVTPTVAPLPDPLMVTPTSRTATVPKS